MPSRQQALETWQAEFLPRIKAVASAVALLQYSVEAGDVAAVRRALELAETRIGGLTLAPLGPAYPNEDAA